MLHSSLSIFQAIWEDTLESNSLGIIDINVYFLFKINFVREPQFFETYDQADSMKI
jgi:hypothetical protein